MQVNITITNRDVLKVDFKKKTLTRGHQFGEIIIARPVFSLVVLAKLLWSLTVLPRLHVVLVFTLLVLLFPFVCPFAELICPLVVLPCPLRVSVCPLVIFMILSVCLFITDLTDAGFF